MSTDAARQTPSLAASSALLDELSRWVAAGWVRALDLEFARFLAQRSPSASPWLILGAALTSHQLGRGHACLDLAVTLADAGQALALPPERATARPGEPAPTAPAQLLSGLDLAGWLRALRHPELVEVVAPGADGLSSTPLVLSGSRLYLRRYWQCEREVRSAIAQRLAPTGVGREAPDDASLAAALAVLFPPVDGAGTDWQKIACALATRRHFSIITGGPGTGKTTTVVRLLAVLQHLARSASGRPRRLRIRLAAPTGKAAARLGESIGGAVDRLALDALGEAQALRDAIPREVSTVHRLLGSRPDSRHFRHDRANPLPLDVLVLDEASMLDLELMAAVMAALPASARLILLGDKDQLASVEAGAVLGDLCQRADEGHYLAETAAWLEAVTGEMLPADLCDARGRALDQAVVKLRVSHRFSADSGIGQLAEAVNAGDPVAVRRCLARAPADLALPRLAGAGDLRAWALGGAVDAFPQGGQGRRVGEQAVPPPVGYRHYLQGLRAQRPQDEADAGAFQAWAASVLRAYGQFQLLCAMRLGPHGVDTLNQTIADQLRAEGLLGPEQGGWYEGRPVLVTRNDHGLGLMNGDVGVALMLPQRRQDGGPARPVLRVAFAAANVPGGVRWVLPSRLRAVETVFAMTVHKSQGSEFTHAALVLPDGLSPVLTRELIYTGITRARHWFSLGLPPGGAAVLESAVQRRVQRASGLMLD